MRLEGLNPVEYEHPEDTAGLEALENIPGVRDVALKIWETWLDKQLLFESTASYVEIKDSNSKRLYGLFRTACEILDFKDIPPFYLMNDQDGNIQAMAQGVNRPFVSISYGCVERFNDQEMLWLIGHELGHIKSGHVLYRSIARQFEQYFKKLGSLSLGLSNLAALPAEAINVAMNYWSRMSELTSDRAGLLVCRDIDTAVTGIIKLAGFPSNDCSRISYLEINQFIDTFKEQARDFKSFEKEEFNKLVRYYVTSGKSHPWNVLRVSELLKWIDSGDFDRILKRERILVEEIDNNKLDSMPFDSKFCPNCGATITQGMKFCATCGTKVNKGT